VIKQDEELDKLEEDIRILKNKYDQFFGGRSKLPPMQERRNIEVAIHEINKQKMRDNTRRFRFNQLLTRFNQYRELWSRKMREREEGPLEFRRRQALMAGPEPAAPHPTRVADAEEARTVTSGRADPYVKVAQGSNGEAIRRIYEQIEKEHLKMGKLPPMTIEQLGEMIAKQSETIRSRYHVETIGFRVETIDGKVKLKAKPLQE
jgi:hypothetical protein